MKKSELSGTPLLSVSHITRRRTEINERWRREKRCIVCQNNGYNRVDGIREWKIRGSAPIANYDLHPAILSTATRRLSTSLSKEYEVETQHEIVGQLLGILLGFVIAVEKVKQGEDNGGMCNHDEELSWVGYFTGTIYSR